MGRPVACKQVFFSFLEADKQALVVKRENKGEKEKEMEEEKVN